MGRSLPSPDEVFWHSIRTIEEKVLELKNRLAWEQLG